MTLGPEVKITLADGSIWIDPPNYLDGSGCSFFGNRRHVGQPRARITPEEARIIEMLMRDDGDRPKHDVPEPDPLG